MSKELLKWYDSVKRDLPWRVDTNPYKVWLSEIMLQQTQVVTVIGYFNRFIDKYPDVYTLANADESDVFKLWEGLGYYSRARNLLKCARTLVNTYGGVFPESVEALVKLPGIGPYTAGAIASIAFNQRVPAVDGNVLRVISRLNCIELPINNPKHMSVFQSNTTALMTERPGDFTQGLMELGATVCTPKRPRCETCPLLNQCCAYKNETMDAFPVKLPKAHKREVSLAILILVHENDILVVKSPDEGLLGSLWGFPRLELDDSMSKDDGRVHDVSKAQTLQIHQHLQEFYGIQAEICYKLEGKPHIFTHLKWKPILFFLYVNDKISIEFPLTEWTEPEGLKLKALPTAFTKQVPLIIQGLHHMKNTNSEG